MGSGISSTCYSNVIMPHPEALADEDTSMIQIETSLEATETSSASDFQGEPDKSTGCPSACLSRSMKRPKSCAANTMSKLDPPQPSPASMSAPIAAPITIAIPNVRTRRHKVHHVASIPDANDLAELTNGGEIRFIPSSLKRSDLDCMNLSSGQLAKLSATIYHGRARYSRLLLAEGISKHSNSLLLLYDLISHSLQSGKFIISLLDTTPKEVTTLSYMRLILTCVYWDYPEYSAMYPVLLRLGGLSKLSHDDNSIVTTVCFNAYPGPWSPSASIWCRKLRAQECLYQHIHQLLADYQKKLRVKTILAGDAIHSTKKYKIDYSFVIELIAFDIIRRILVGDASLSLVMSNLLPIFSCTSASYVRAIHTNPRDIYSVMTNTVGSPLAIPDLFQLILNKAGVPAFRVQFSETFVGNLVALEGVWYVVDTIKYVTASRFYGSDYVNVPLHWYCKLFPQASNLLCTNIFPILYSVNSTETDGSETILSSLKYNLNFIKNQCFHISGLQDAMSFFDDQNEEAQERIRRTLDTVLSVAPKIVSFNQPVSLSHTGSLSSILQLVNSPLTPTGRPSSTIRDSSPSKAKTPSKSIRSKPPPISNKQSNSPTIKRFVHRRLGNSTSYIQANERISLSQTLVNIDDPGAQALMKGLRYILYTGAYSIHGWIIPEDCKFDSYTLGPNANRSNITTCMGNAHNPPLGMMASQSQGDTDSCSIRYAIYTLLERLLAELKVSIDSYPPNLKLSTPPLSSRPSSIGRHTQKTDISMTIAISNFQVRVEQQCFYRIQFFRDTVMAKQPFVLKEHRLSINMATKLSVDAEEFKSVVSKLKEYVDTLVFDNKLRMMIVFDDQAFSVPVTEEEEYNLLNNMNKLLKHVFYASKCSSREQMTRKGRGILGGNGKLYFLIEFVKLL